MTEHERIDQIEQSLAGLEKQLYSLKAELRDLKQATAAESVPATVTASDTVPVKPAAAAASVSNTPKPVSEPAFTASAAPAKASSSAANQAAPHANNKKTSSRFEENLGGKVMGIVAAILVFVGLLLFGSMLYERLGDTARVAILFLFSFLILGTGLFLERRHASRFTTSLIGCGFGAVYISLFITALYYQMLTTEPLYILLFFWLITVGLYVFRKQSFTVALLGQGGMAFSVLFGCVGVESAGQFTFLCFYFALLSLLYLWIVLWRFLPSTKDKPYSWIHLVAVGLNVIQLWTLAANYSFFFGKWGEFGGKNLPVGILLALYCLVLPLFFLLRQRAMAELFLLPWKTYKRPIDEKTFPVYKNGLLSVIVFSINQIATWIVFSQIANVVFEAELPHCLFVLLGLLLSFLIAELFGPTGTEGYGVGIVTALALCFSFGLYSAPGVIAPLVSMVFCTVTALFGILGTEYPLCTVYSEKSHRWEYSCREIKGRRFEKFTSCVYFIPLMCSYHYDDPVGKLLLITLFGLFFLSAAFLYLYRDGREHPFNDAWKTVLYVTGMIFLFWTSGSFLGFTDLRDVEQMVIALTLLVACNSICYYSGFRKKLAEPDVTDDASTLVIRLVHTALWIWGMALLHSGSVTEHPFLCMWLIVLTLFLCGSGMHEQYKRYRNHTGLGIYFGLRVTLYVLVVLAAFEGIEGYVISCTLLMLAILAILAGFPLRLAPLRIYGLCLAMFAVVKLLMIDVEHDNSMETVLCFLGAGILCFAINFIYNHVKKWFQDEDD